MELSCFFVCNGELPDFDIGEVDWSTGLLLQPTSVMHNSSDKLCPISSLFTSFIQEVIYDLDEEMFSCCF